MPTIREPGWLHRHRFHIATVILLPALLEVISFLAFTLVLTGRNFRARDLDALGMPPTQADMDAWRASGWDRELGWLRRPGTRATIEDPKRRWSFSIDERGVRREPFDGERRGFVSVYGDSFTFGHEVDDDRTWPHYLSELLGTRVDNWGHSAWGPDQAVLRLRRNLPRERTDVVVLGVMSENINRLVSCYRAFLTGDADMKLAFKPMLAPIDGTLQWIPNPLERADTPADFHAAFERAKVNDYWYAENARRIRVRFPYLLRLPAAVAFVIRQPGRPNLYRDPAAVARLDRVIDEFRSLANEHDFIPVVLFIPEPTELERFVEGGENRYQPYVAELRTRTEGTGLVVVDVLEHQFDAARFNRRPFKDHPSPYGNQVIAGIVREVIAPARARRP